MKRIIKKSVFLIIVFITISFFASYATYLIEQAVKSQKEICVLLSRDAKKFSLNSGEEVQQDDSLLHLNSNYTLVKKGVNLEDFRAVFFKGKLNKKPPILTGRFFDESDFGKNKNLAVVGKVFQQVLIKEDGKEYYYDGKTKYEVIGVLGDSKMKTTEDYLIYINLDSILNKDGLSLKGDYYIDAGEKTSDILANIKQIYTNKQMDFKEEKEEESPLGNLLFSENGNVKLVVQIVIIFILNTVCVTEHWIKNRKNEIGIKRAMGSTKLKISISILKELLLTSTISFILGYLVYIFVAYLQDGYIHYYFKSVIVSYVICIISVLITSLVPIYRANKMEPAEIMR